MAKPLRIWFAHDTSKRSSSKWRYFFLGFLLLGLLVWGPLGWFLGSGKLSHLISDPNVRICSTAGSGDRVVKLMPTNHYSKENTLKKELPGGGEAYFLNIPRGTSWKVIVQTDKGDMISKSSLDLWFFAFGTYSFHCTDD